MNYGVFISIIVILAIASIWVGISTTRKTKNNKEYYLSGRNLSIFGLTLTFLATQLGGGALIGNAQAAYEYGWKSIYYSGGLSLGLIALSLGLGARFRKLNISTLPELMTKQYHSKTLRNLATFLSVTSLFFILIALGVAARKFFIAIGVESTLVFMAFWSVAIIYTVFGGLTAVVKTDIFQILFIAAVLVIVGFMIFFTDTVVPIGDLLQAPASKAIPWSDWLLMPFLFVIIGQDMGQRCFAAKSPRAVSISTFAAGISLLLLSLIPTYLGMQAAFLNPGMSLEGSILMQFVEQITSPVMTSFFAAGVLMAIMSTADSLICSISLNISYDLLPLISQKQSEKVGIARLITFLVGFSALLLSTFVDEIIAMMVFAYKISILTFFVPLIMCLFLKRPRKSAAWTAIITGIVGFLVAEKLDIPIDFYTIALSTILFLVVQGMRPRIKA